MFLGFINTKISNKHVTLPLPKKPSSIILPTSPFFEENVHALPFFGE